MPALDHLVSLFYSNIAELGAFEEVLAEAVPEPYRRLLAHHEHMTVAVERYHGSPVDVKVLETQQSGDYYSRKIVLHRQSDRRIVLFGIPRLNLRLVDESVRREILSENKPLGRVLIVVGLVIAAVGLVMVFGSRIPVLGHLPGDITIKGDNVTVFIPLGTMLVVSILASLVLSLLNRR